MGRPKRAEQFSYEEVGVVHVMQRCVRRAFLAGKDPVTGKDFGFRREWIRRRMELLASVFGLDLLTYAVMSNHLHLVIRTRPDVVERWSDEEVAIRWLKLFPGKRLEEHLGEPTEIAVEQLLNTPKRVSELRKRLADVSWFMKCLSEPIARLANKQEKCTGRFWEGRFKAQKIVDEAGLLACAMYVDLNPVRAAMVDRPEKARFTSVYDRIRSEKGQGRTSHEQDLDQHLVEQSDEQVVLEKRLANSLKVNKSDIARLRRKLSLLKDSARNQRSQRMRRARVDAWLCPLELSERESPNPKVHKEGVRASDKGFLSMRFSDYLKLLDWVGRQKRVGKRGSMPKSLDSILDRLGVRSSMFADLVWDFQRYFGRSRAAGKPDSLATEAKKSHRYWIPGQRSAAECFS